jgi:CBS domain-containing protein
MIAGIQHASARKQKNPGRGAGSLAPMQRSSSHAVPLGNVPVRRPVCIDRDATILAASRLMRAQDVVDLVVTEPLDGTRVPAGVISARDIVARIVACDLDAAVVTVGDILWSRTTPGRVGDSAPETLIRLCATGTESLPVVDSNGMLAGVVSVDDLLQVLADR